MRRFDADDNEEFQDELEEMFEFEFDEDFAAKSEIISVLQLDLVEYDINQKLLQTVIKMCEKSWGWRFRRTKTKVRIITEAYKSLADLMDRTEKKKDEEEGGDADIPV